MEMEDGLLELLTNENFKNWVLHPTPVLETFWNDWLDRHPRERDTVLKAKEMIRNTTFATPAFSEEEKQEILERILSAKFSVWAGPMDKTISNQWRQLVYKMSAAVIILVSLFAIWLRAYDTSDKIQMIVKETAPGVKSRIAMPDGSQVFLNAGSRITYRTDFGKDARVIQLEEGEAYFDVAPDTSRPFQVVSAGYVTTALGTAFNIQAFRDGPRLEIALQHGRILITRPEEDSHFEMQLAPGEGLMITRATGRSEKVAVDTLRAFGWKSGVLVFNEYSFEEVVKTLERWYGVQIRVTGKPQLWSFNGRFDNKSLDQVLESLSFTYDLSYSIHGKIVELNLTEI